MKKHKVGKPEHHTGRCKSRCDGNRCTKRAGHSGVHYALRPTGGWGKKDEPDEATKAEGMMDFDELMSSHRLRFVATGKTYQYQETLRSRSWHWNEARQVWVNENEDSADQFCIRNIASLPGITVTCEGLVEPPEAGGDDG